MLSVMRLYALGPSHVKRVPLDVQQELLYDGSHTNSSSVG